jgi:hypothetical protein
MPTDIQRKKSDIEDLMPPLTVAVIAFIAPVVIFTTVWAWQVKSNNAGMIDPVARACGATRGIRTTSSNACIGARTFALAIGFGGWDCRDAPAARPDGVAADESLGRTDGRSGIG